MKIKDKTSILVLISTILTIVFVTLSTIYPEKRIFFPLGFMALSLLNLLNCIRLFNKNRFQSILALIVGVFSLFVAIFDLLTI